MGAALPHAKKYVIMHRRLFPNTPIILVLSSPRHFFQRASTRHASLQPAISLLQTSQTDDGTLIHVLSNGGARMLDDMLSLAPNLGGSGTKILFDSTPGELNLRNTISAFLAPIRPFYLRAIGSVLLAVFYLFTVWMPTTLFGSVNVIERVRRHLNDPAIVSVSDTKRAYIYSDEDELVQSWAVEKHVADAKRQGYAMNLVKMSGSRHVEHLRKYPKEYEDTVLLLWKS
ncbi:hypothetical protein PUNSTDRAFT_90715 [Punctularia strigosozonata HHB-11173 SS5]|uniref:uncharacterized protein n=1 Tax=Punctularia strigosozonata (strain HHB-11173) TaxID=741275 RepID=UPI0004416AED|nr:uncharacterized protein PUNSTDRAFT_90715 [Punctularia strigosozonata HHB-11173 SS5]EIN05989.1 hypothetical protein PUNSTDRAFT_90715 [Punctularia strigosozonata HHB-11173 SS5]